jgi:hypothetical protein
MSEILPQAPEICPCLDCKDRHLTKKQSTLVIVIARGMKSGRITTENATKKDTKHI